MSAEATGWVWKHSPYRSDPRKMLVHLAIADVVNDTHGNQFWMSNATLAEKVGTSREVVNRVVSDMVSRGLLRTVYAEQGRTVIYEMRMPAAGGSGDAEGCDLTSQGVEHEVTGGVTSGHTKLKRTQEELKVHAHPSAGRQRREARQSELFDEFWAAYPRKVGKVAAQKAWKRLTKTGDLEAITDEMAAGLARWLTFWRKQRTETEYIPYPATWLNQRRWEDKPSEETA